jgi:hypothetical protein
MKTLTVFEAQGRLAELIAEADCGEVVILKDGDREVTLHPGRILDPFEDSPELEVELLKAVDGLFQRYRRDEMRSIVEKASDLANASRNSFKRRLHRRSNITVTGIWAKVANLWRGVLKKLLIKPSPDSPRIQRWAASAVSEIPDFNTVDPFSSKNHWEESCCSIDPTRNAYIFFD